MTNECPDVEGRDLGTHNTLQNIDDSSTESDTTIDDATL